MTPEQMTALTIAAMEHDGHTLTPSDKREIQRQAITKANAARRHDEMMASPTYHWKKPTAWRIARQRRGVRKGRI